MVDEKTIMAELHIDETEEETALIKNLIDDAETLIVGSISSQREINKDYVEKVNGQVFGRMVRTLVTDLYYDRTLTNGYSKGFRIMMNQLRSEVLMEVEREEFKPKL
ncbi:head-tail connector protein [Weissella viridescens]|uniref:head-tail connector protein n=1 Tax=Weissella viridescens TaxID=1629 RepID=UPI003AF245D1